MARSKNVRSWTRQVASMALLPLALSSWCGSAQAQCNGEDDGVSETAVGFAPGGEFGWMHVYPCTENVAASLAWVEVAYGSAALPGAFTNGGPSRIVVFEDTDDDWDPNTGLVLLAERSTVVVNAGTDLFTVIPFLPGGPGFGEGVAVLITADVAPGEAPAPVDSNTQAPDAWVVGNSAGPGSIDLSDLANNTLAPTPLSTYAAPGQFLLRAQFADLLAFYTSCFGDGSGAPCGCGNESGPPPGGCANSAGTGAFLFQTGCPCFASDTVELRATGAVPGQPGLFFQGNVMLGPSGGGLTFGDGLRCCGQGVLRIATVAADAAGCASSHGSCGTPLSPSPGPISDLPGNAGLSPGDTRCYQYWYRDPAGPCGTGFNLSSALVTIWF